MFVILRVLNLTLYSICGSRLFSSPLTIFRGYLVSLQSIHLLCCLFIPLNQTISFFCIILPKGKTHNSKKTRYIFVAIFAQINWYFKLIFSNKRLLKHKIFCYEIVDAFTNIHQIFIYTWLKNKEST